MILPLLLSAFAAGLIATALMVFFLYLPRLWGGQTYDVMGALGSAMVGRETQQARFMGTTTYYLAGLVFSVLYGLVALEMLETRGTAGVPVFAGAPVAFDPIYPLLGGLIGFVHGAVVAILVMVVVIEHHPLEKFRRRVGLVPSQVISHVIFGATVMFFHHQFLQLLLDV